MGVLSIIIAAGAGMVLTMLIHSSSAATAIVITLAVEGIIDMEMAAGLVLGCNIGTTIDAFLASLGASSNAKRAAWIHILFNVIGSVWAIIFFKPFLSLVNIAAGSTTIAQHIAMMHTLFNLINTLLFAPFAYQFANLVSRMIKEKPEEEKQVEKLEYFAPPLMGSTEMNMVRIRIEIEKMTGLCSNMFSRWQELFKNPDIDLESDLETFKQYEDYADQMRYELTRFLLDSSKRDIYPVNRPDTGILMRMIVDLEEITDNCFSLIWQLHKAKDKEIVFDKLETQNLMPYIDLAEEFLHFVKDNINSKITEEQLKAAQELENKIDEFRAALKRKSRKRLQAGADVRTELMFMDIIRQIERIGDHSFSVAYSLRELA
jgi:phosphate:Na+ symporter